MKCSETSVEFRNRGNEFFREKKFPEALVAYNKSLSYAEKGSGDLGLAFANRSAVYFEMKMFEECLGNIKQAVEHDYPKEKLQKLQDREEKCKNFLKNYKQEEECDPQNFFKLSREANKKIPFIIDCIEPRDCEKFGFYLTTNSNLKTGEIIAIEEPFYKFLDNEAIHSRCARCLKSNKLNLIPCESCTTTMYCSSSCQTEHFNIIHKLECCKKPLPPVLSVCTEMLNVAISIAGSLSELNSIVDNPKRKTVFDFDLSDPSSSSYNRNLLSVINSCAMSESSAIVITEKMKAIFDRPPFDTLWDTKEERDLLIDIFHRQLRILNTNQLEMGEPTFDTLPDGKFWYSKTIGSGLCPFASLFNHSCDANVKRYTVDNKIVFVVGKPIMAGEQLFISYGYSSHRMPKIVRQKQLERFSFNCTCEACERNFPLLADLPRFDENFIEPRLIGMTMDEAMGNFRRNCEYIEKTVKNHPSYETTTMMNYNDHVVNQISRVRMG